MLCSQSAYYLNEVAVDVILSKACLTLTKFVFLDFTVTSIYLIMFLFHQKVNPIIIKENSGGYTNTCLF